MGAVGTQCWSLGITAQTTQTPISVKQGWFIEHTPQDWSTKATFQIWELNQDIELRFYRVVKLQIKRKHLCKLFDQRGFGLGIGGFP